MILGSRHCLQGFIPPSKLFLDLRFRSKLGNKQPHSYQKYGIFVCHIWNSILAHYYENFNPTELKLSSSMWSMIFCVFVAVKLQFSEKWREIWLLEVVFLVVLNSIIGIPLYLPYLIWWFRAIIIQSCIFLHNFVLIFVQLCHPFINNAPWSTMMHQFCVENACRACECECEGVWYRSTTYAQEQKVEYLQQKSLQVDLLGIADTQGILPRLLGGHIHQSLPPFLAAP